MWLKIGILQERTFYELGFLFFPPLPLHLGVQLDHLSLLKQFEHLDPQNQHTFEARDLELLIQTVA